MRLSAICVLAITLAVCLGTAQAWTGFSSVVSRLKDFQAQGGGFKGTSGKPTAEATNNALLLASLYGLTNKVNTTEATKFITSLENSDGGYGPTPGSPSDVESTRNALQSLQHIGAKPAHPDKVLNYIKSVWDSSNNLFAIRSGDKGSVRGTAFALQSIEALDQLNQGWVKDALPKIKTVLSKHKPADAFYFSFPEDKDTSTITANYYGIIVGNYVGYEFTSPAKWAKYITDLQSTGGQFYDTVEKKATSLASTANAMLSLSALGAVKGVTEKFVDTVNVDNLKKGVRHIAADVASAAHAHSAVALTNAFKNFFKTVVNYDGADSEYITEGSSFSPSVAVHSVFDDNTQHPHGGFDIDTTTTFHGKEAHKGKLSWDETLQRYTGLNVATLGNLGPVKFAANLARKVAGLGNLGFDIDLSKSVGYGITVVPKVSQEGGADIKEGQAVSQGTDFKFTVALNTFSNNNLLSGDFVVTFSVLDSSLATVYTTSVDGSANKDPITFTYKLSANDIPAGVLSFRFDVAGKGARAPHTTRTLRYNYLVSLVAAHISLGSAKSYKLGDKVKVTMEPAAFPDLRTTHALATKDATGTDVTDRRKFFLDIKSPQGTLIRSVPSTSSKGSTKYTFDFTVEPTLDHIGSNVLSFRYVPAVGDEITLQNFDTDAGELYDDTNVLSYLVKSALSLVDVSDSPKSGNLFYGGNVGYKFRLKDEESGLHVYSSEKPLGNVYLDLSHEEKGARPYSSVRHPASITGEGDKKRFHINWDVNPNAVTGEGKLGLSVTDVDGNPIAVKNSKSVKVNIGGSIDVTPDVYTTSIQTSSYTALVAEFTLSCQGKQLKNADLLANVERDGKVVATVPVAHNNGRYEISLTGSHKEVPSGSYKFAVYRVADRARAQERREQRLKRERKERDLKGDVPVTAEDEGLGVEPLFTVNVPYSAPALTSLPVRAEFLSVVLLGGLLGYLSFKKNAIYKIK